MRCLVCDSMRYEKLNLGVDARDERHESGFPPSARSFGLQPSGPPLMPRVTFAPRAFASAYSPCSVKEVIQPQVPLRLPCYDFAPVTALAFGRLAPCGFRHGLRALTASMA